MPVETIEVPFEETPVSKKKKTRGKKKRSTQAKSESDGLPIFASLSDADLDNFVADHDIEIESWHDLSLLDKRKKLSGMFGQPMISIPSGVFEDSSAIATPETFADIVAQVEGVSSEDEAVKLIGDLQDSKDLAAIRTGGILLLMKTNGWYGGEGFYEFVAERFVIEKRKAQALIQIYERLTSLNLADWDAFKGVGWAKLRAIASMLTNENYKKILKEISGMTLMEVTAYVKEAHGKDSGYSATNKIYRFAVDEDGAGVIDECLAAAKEESPGASDSIVLVNICTSYLNGGTKAVMSLEDALVYHRKSAKSAKQALEDLKGALASVWSDKISF